MSSAFRLSVGANLALLGIVGLLLWRNHRIAVPPLPPASRAAAVRPKPSKTSALRQVRPPDSAGPKFTPAAIAQLEQLGFSRDTLVGVLIQELNLRSTQRLAALQRQYAPKLVPDREMLEFSRQCDAEQVQAIKAAFGEDGYRAWDKGQTLRELNRARAPGDELPLTADEAERAYRLQKEFDQKAKELQMAMEDGVADRADVSALQAQAQQALDRNLEKLLGKERFDALRGNTDPTVDVYRRYGDLDPTPDQAKAVLAAEGDYRAGEAALAKQLADLPGDALAVAAEVKALQDARDDELRKVLGPDAYDTFQREHDATYQTLRQYAGAWNLQDQEIEPVYEALHAFNEQSSRTRSAAEMRQEAGQRVNWREINAAIEQSRQQAEAGLVSVLGAERLRRLEQNGLLAPH